MKKLFVALFAAFCSFNVIASPVNINTADAKTIAEALSGIGLKKAEAIVKY
ncbi:MAG: helix-hairpin-helix domain-containing protein, partial [Methylobacter sp.]